MEKQSIENIPDELLIEMFKKVDKSTLKNVALSCTKWRDVSRFIPWCLMLTYTNDDGLMDALVKSERTFERMTIDETWNNDTLDLFEKHAGRVKELRLMQCVVNNAQIFVEILKTMPLKRCIAFGVKFSGSFDEESDLPPLDKLKTLEIVQCDYNILKCFEKANLSTFKLICSPTQDDKLLDEKPLLNFFRTQQNLKTLALQTITSDNSQLFKTPIKVEDFPFKLQKLSLLCCYLDDDQHLQKFLQMQAQTVEDLEIGHALADSTYELIFAKFKKLRCLKFNAGCIPTDLEFYQRLETNNSVTKLIIRAEAKSKDALVEFLLHLPNVESLVLAQTSEKPELEAASISLTRLKHLVIINMFDEDKFVGLRFPNLETLCLEKIYHGNVDWSTFTSENPGIIELSIKDFSIDLPNLTAIADNLKLRVLRIGKKFCADKEFFEIVREKCKDLKLLCIHSESMQIDISEVADLRCLRFHHDEQNCFDYHDNDDGEFWNNNDYDGLLPFDDVYHLEDEMDSFELQMMMEDMGIDEDFVSDESFVYVWDGQDYDIW